MRISFSPYYTQDGCASLHAPSLFRMWIRHQYDGNLAWKLCFIAMWVNDLILLCNWPTFPWHWPTFLKGKINKFSRSRGALNKDFVTWFHVTTISPSGKEFARNLRQRLFLIKKKSFKILIHLLYLGGIGRSSRHTW